MTFNWIPLFLVTLSIGIHVSEGFNTRAISPLSPRILAERSFGCYATTKERKIVEPTNGESINGVNGSVNGVNGINGQHKSTKTRSATKADPAALVKDYNVTQMLDEISQKINDGSMEVIENITNAMDERFVIYY